MQRVKIFNLNVGFVAMKILESYLPESTRNPIFSFINSGFHASRLDDTKRKRQQRIAVIVS